MGKKLEYNLEEFEALNPEDRREFICEYVMENYSRFKGYIEKNMCNGREEESDEIMSRFLVRLCSLKRDGEGYKTDLFAPGRRLEPWLYTIITNTSIDYKREEERKKRDQISTSYFKQKDTGEYDSSNYKNTEPFEIKDESAKEPCEKAIIEEDRQITEEFLRNLPKKLREILELRFFKSLKFPEIGEPLGIPSGTVKSRYHQGITDLKTMLEQEGYSEEHFFPRAA